MKKALVIGIDEYPKAELKGCANDASAVSELLRTNGDGSPNFEVVLKQNIKTKAEAIELIEQLFSGNADAALLYFSGHGSEQGHLVFPDYIGKDFGILMSQILGYANSSKCKNKIIILDCCYSGKFGESSIFNSNESILGEGITIMTASSRNEVAVEDGEQGLFTNLFLQGLRGSASDITGKITPAGIYAFIDQSLGVWQQRPIFKTNITHFISIRDIEPKVPKRILRKISQYFDSPSSEFQLDPSYEFTNSLDYKHETIEPYANNVNVNIFKELQLFESVGLIEPVDEDHMYFAAMKNKTCKLTALGLHYWKLSKDFRF